MANLIMFNIEVAYADQTQQALIGLQVAPGTSVLEAIYQSNILTQFSTIDLSYYKVGIFSEIVTLTTRVQAGDRVEIYHPLLIDPKVARKQRAKKQNFYLSPRERSTRSGG